MKTFADHIIDFYFNLDGSSWKLPDGISLLDPFKSTDVKPLFTQFYKKYFDDNQQRHLILGINPGRFGAGVTGISFTDPKILEQYCGIANTLQKRNELSAIFIYEMIDYLGGVESFYKRFFISSVVPLGFVKNAKNINYYDDKTLENDLKPVIVDCLAKQIEFGVYTDKIFILGQGKNYKYFQQLNEELGWFDQVIPLPHPRWVMQYRLKSKQLYLDEFLGKLT